MGGIKWVQEGKSIYSETERGDITEFSEKGDICWVILVPIGRDNCVHCDPRFRLVLAPEKTRNNMLLRDQVTFNNNHVIFRRDFKPTFKTLNPLLYE